MTAAAASPLLKGLNPAQSAAVSAPDEHMLVLAGAGSGKTRVLIHRIAWLMQERGVPTYSILAVTFTNKAAAEMKSRLDRMGLAMGGMWVGTFHGLCHRWLRDHPEEAGLPNTFQVLDSDDQLRLIKRVMVDLQVDPDVISPRKVQEWINGHKDAGLRAGQIKIESPDDQIYKDIMMEYEERCQIAGLVDFGELLLRTHEMFENNPALLESYRTRFTHLLVDEFQDTNVIQYRIVQLLAGTRGVVLVVGDDSQSIYAWRGAQVENMQRFLDEFPGAQIYRLEQNYRSFPAVLTAANALIANNAQAIPKKLWTSRTESDPIQLYTAADEQDEARHVVNEIKRWVAQGGKVEDCAVLYRSNAMSRPVEEALLVTRMPYKITGGQRFFERAEIKDAMAYLRLAMSTRDDGAFERVANVPTRGMGDKSLTAIRDHARARRQPLWDAGKDLIATGGLPKRAASSLNDFMSMVDRVRAATQGVSLSLGVEAMLKITDLRSYHGKDSRNELDRNRIENLDELISVAARFSPLEGAPADPLLAFLTHAALEAGEAAAAEKGPAIQLMTLHAAKGLEFPCVFIIGWEDGIFPGEKVLSDPDPRKLEEERRLAYVGITRAEHRLTLTHAFQRRRFGQLMMNPLSRFIHELPRDILVMQNSRGQTQALPPVGPGAARRLPAPPLPTEGNTGLRRGSSVEHETFGKGVVASLDLVKRQAKVAFRGFGIKNVATGELSPPSK